MSKRPSKDHAHKSEPTTKPVKFIANDARLRCLQRSLQDLYGLLWFHCGQGKHKWNIGSAQLAEELGIKKIRWIYCLLSRLRELKLIGSRRRGQGHVSEYWILPFPDADWLANQITTCGRIERIKNKDLASNDVPSEVHLDVPSEVHQDVPSEVHHCGLSPFAVNKTPAARRNRKELSLNKGNKPFSGSGNASENGRVNENLRPTPRDSLGRCAYCANSGRTILEGNWCACQAGVQLALEEWNKAQTPQRKNHDP